jgi:hypothetical protein
MMVYWKRLGRWRLLEPGRNVPGGTMKKDLRAGVALALDQWMLAKSAMYEEL